MSPFSLFYYFLYVCMYVCVCVCSGVPVFYILNISDIEVSVSCPVSMSKSVLHSLLEIQ